MIQIEIYRNQKKEIYGFQLSGHAGYAEEGADIVCSAVTILVFNTINCIEKMTEEVFTCDVDEKEGGFLRFLASEIKQGKHNHDAALLLQAMAYGLKDIENEYSGFIQINDEEV